MAGTAEKTDPALWNKVKRAVTRGAKGGKPGQWSARKAQLAVSEYKAEGGGYRGRKSADNHLEQWQREDWGTKSGRKSGSTGERYLPRKARESLSDEEYRRSTAKKRADSRQGRQFSAQPKDVARKAAKARHAADAGGTTKAALMAEARKRDIRGRSRMTKGELAKALGHAA
ncbi:hypothetical protein E0493_06100 [Roseomonas sp. M0104]|uniref:DUF5872 domain-containing protein n=1 Tax=Teichococcus coralli TaxID=2545983 RepID=A0A845B5M3_9PROT|nr:DUF5872 domain-containing protein [Pseudoroseomonas coralli]MXP62923.1 hypothetical protein [Pseudoroseomonas coralli]